MQWISMTYQKKKKKKKKKKSDDLLISLCSLIKYDFQW